MSLGRNIIDFFLGIFRRRGTEAQRDFYALRLSVLAVYSFYFFTAEALRRGDCFEPCDCFIPFFHPGDIEAQIGLYSSRLSVLAVIF